MPRATDDPRENVVRTKTPKADPALGRSGRPKTPVSDASLANLTQNQPGAGEWQWTKKKRLALSLFLEGNTINSIGKQVGKHRNTIRKWLRTPEFVEELTAQLEEYKISKRVRRMKINGALLDRCEKVILEAFKEADDPNNKITSERLLKKIRGWTNEMRAARADERADFGDNVQRVEGQINLNGNVNHNHKHVHNVSFLDLAKQVIVPGTVVKAETAEKATAMIAEKILTETDFMEQVHAEEATDLEKALIESKAKNG